MRNIAIAISAAISLAACSAPAPKTFMMSEASDDRTCRSFMRNKQKDDPTTYEECRQGLIEMANMPVYAPPPQPNVTVIVNQ